MHHLKVKKKEKFIKLVFYENDLPMLSGLIKGKGKVLQNCNVISNCYSIKTGNLISKEGCNVATKAYKTPAPFYDVL